MTRFWLILVSSLLACSSRVGAFAPGIFVQRSTTATATASPDAASVVVCHLSSSTTSTTESSTVVSSNQRSGILQSLLNLALASPLWKLVLVPQARQKMMDTAMSNGIPWQSCCEWISSQMDDTTTDDVLDDDSTIPSYYSSASFHAYEKGNLCWEAAWEQEIASAAVGARNFPTFGKQGEVAFRQSFQAALEAGGASVPQSSGSILDLGCGTGTSTRWLAERYPQADEIIGMDLSPYFIKVGQKLLELEPNSLLTENDDDDATWINDVRSDSRIDLRVGAAESTGLPDNSVDIVNLLFVAHECPAVVTLSILQEAHRVLKNDGQLWFCEMDFETPGYAAQRANPLLFSLIRATEPYLDDYADASQSIRNELQRLFSHTIIQPATGRHFAIVATKGESGATNDDDHVLQDLRFDENGVYKVEDTHLILWDNKEN